MNVRRIADSYSRNPIECTLPDLNAELPARDRGAPFLRFYLMLLAFPVLAAAVLVVRCAHFPLLLRFSNFLTRLPSTLVFFRNYACSRPQEAVWAVNMLVRGVGIVKISGLERSIAVRFLLAQMGIESRIRLGVQRRNQQFVAHAWVEIEPSRDRELVVGYFDDQLHMQQPFLAFPETPF